MVSIPCFCHLRLVLGRGAAEEAAVDLRMQRLDAPVEDLGRAGVGRDLGDPRARFAQRARRAAGRQDVDAVALKAARQLFDAALVGDGDQGPADPNHVPTPKLGTWS